MDSATLDRKRPATPWCWVTHHLTLTLQPQCCHQQLYFQGVFPLLCIIPFVCLKTLLHVWPHCSLFQKKAKQVLPWLHVQLTFQTPINRGHLLDLLQFVNFPLNMWGSNLNIIYFIMTGLQAQFQSSFERGLLF